MAIQSQYLHQAFSQSLFKRAVKSTISVAERLKKEYDYDTIAFSGISGSAMAFILSYELDIPLICVRRYEEDSHYIRETRKLVEGNIDDVRKYIIVDDFISSGATVRRIIDQINAYNLGAECVAMIMYAGFGYLKSWVHPVTEQQIIIEPSKTEYE